MTTSAYQVSTPPAAERTGIVRADRFRATVRTFFEGRLHAAPLNGGTRAKERKVAGDITISVDEVARLLAHADGENAVPFIRGLVSDAGIDDKIVVRYCEPMSHCTLTEAELEFVAASSIVVTLVDNIRRRGFVTSVEQRRFHEAAMALEARERTLLFAAQWGGFDNA